MQLLETIVTYTLECDGAFFVIENIPAHVCQETGEQYFDPQTVEHIQSIIINRPAPDKVIETQVYESR